MSYDHWKTTEPEDDFFAGSEPPYGWDEIEEQDMSLPPRSPAWPATDLDDQVPF